MEGTITWKDYSHCETTVTVGGRAALHNGGSVELCQEEKRGCHGPHNSSQGLGLVLPLTAHATLEVPRSTEHCFLWSQVKGAVREHLQSPWPVSPGRKGSPWRNMNREGSRAQGRHGCCPPNSGLCQTHRNPSVQRKETGRPSRGSTVPVCH